MTKKYLYIIFAFAALFSSCSDYIHQQHLDEETANLKNYVSKCIAAGTIPDSSFITPSGMYFIPRQIGLGEVAYTGDIVRLRISAFTLDSTLLFTNKNNTEIIPSTFTLGNTEAASFPNFSVGIHEAVSRMNVGSEATLLLPSILTKSKSEYDMPNGTAVKGYTSLRVEVKLTDIDRANE